MTKKTNNKYNSRKKMSYETVATIAKLKDLSKLIYIFVGLTTILLIVSLFVGAVNLDAKFASLNDKATQQATGAVYSYVPLISNITIGQFALGFENVELGTVFDLTMLIGFVLSFLALVMFFIPLKGKAKKLNKFKFLLSALLLIIGAVLTFATLQPLKEVFGDLLYDMITYGKYDANKSETSTMITSYSYVMFVISIIASIFILIQAAIELYREKKDANY